MFRQDQSPCLPQGSFKRVFGLRTITTRYVFLRKITAQLPEAKRNIPCLLIANLEISRSSLIFFFFFNWKQARNF